MKKHAVYKQTKNTNFKNHFKHDPFQSEWEMLKLGKKKIKNKFNKKQNKKNIFLKVRKALFSMKYNRCFTKLFITSR